MRTRKTIIHKSSFISAENHNHETNDDDNYQHENLSSTNISFDNDGHDDDNDDDIGDNDDSLRKQNRCNRNIINSYLNFHEYRIICFCTGIFHNSLLLATGNI